MKKLQFLSLLLLLLQSTFAQTNLSEYSYIVVPEKYEFLYDNDQYQLNSMTKFLFDKYGFNAYFPNELPNVRRCDGLWAEVQGKPGFIWTSLQLVIRDCYGTVVYKGVEGKSKYKEYRKAYQDALRKAFEGISALDVKQRAVENGPSLEDASGPTPAAESKSPDSSIYMPEDKFSNYTNGENNFLLRKTPKGYTLYREVDTSDDGLELMGRIILEGGSIEYRTEGGAQSSVRFLEGGDFELTGSEGKILYRFKS